MSEFDGGAAGCLTDLIWYIAPLIFLYGLIKYTPFYRYLKLKIQAKILRTISPKSQKLKEVVAEKTKLFATLQDHTSEKPRHILEVGPADCYNFDYYPKNSRLTLVEPNWNFHETLKQRADEVGRHVFVQDIFGDVAEDLKSVRSESVDDYVLTHVMCSVSDIDKTMLEAKRVLKKGGRLYIFHHYRGTQAFAFRFRALLERFIIFPIMGSWIMDCKPDRHLEPLVLKYFPNSKCWHQELPLSLITIRSHFMSVSVNE